MAQLVLNYQHSISVKQGINTQDEDFCMIYIS